MDKAHEELLVSVISMFDKYENLEQYAWQYLKVYIKNYFVLNIVNVPKIKKQTVLLIVTKNFKQNCSNFSRCFYNKPFYQKLIYLLILIINQ